MMIWLQVVLTLSTSLLLFAPASARADSKSQASTDWNRLVDDFFDQYFKLNPTQGTAAGFHQYDAALEDYSRRGIDNQIAFAKDFLRRLDTLDSSVWPLEERQDYRQKMGDNFSLPQFHDTFLRQGFPPIKIVRETMLGEESPTL